MSKLKLGLNLLTSSLLLLASTGAYANCSTNPTGTTLTWTLLSPGAGDCVVNSGEITTSGVGVFGIYTYVAGSTSTNTNSGTITTSGNYSDGIRSLDTSSTNTNSGSITTSGSHSSGIISDGSSSTNTNSGTITTSGPYGHGIYSEGASTTNTNSGTITTSGIGGMGIYSEGASTINTNSGTITTSGSYVYGIYSIGTGTTITNSGTIRTTGINSVGISSLGNDAIISNSGTIKSTGIDGTAIVVGNNNTVNLNRGSVIVGDIYADSAVTGARLNINLGAGVSYAYSVTGPWTITDLDNRPMVTGSAYAAGIGAQETASEMLYQRTSVVTKALDNRVYAYALNESNVQPYWLDVYYGDTSRDAGANYSTRTKFSHDHYGFTVGLTLPAEVTPIELIVNAEHSNLNIDNGSQKIDSDSIMAGILAPKLTEIAGTTLSAKAMLGYSNHDADRKVMSNSQLYDGSYQIKSDYDSYYAVLGASALKPIPINDHLTASVLVGLDLNTQHTESYAEQDFASWNSRTLTQLQSRVQAGFDYTCNEKTHLFGRVGLERRDLISGDTQDYILHNASVSFNANNSNDTYVTGQLGIRSQLEKRIQLIGTISGLRSTDTVSSIQGNIGLRADF